MGVPITTVDAFTFTPFSGNPAAVCILSKPAAEDWMQNVAAEMNLSETAFLCPESEMNRGPTASGLPQRTPGVREYSLRWFAPVCEVELCGHATLASAHVLWERGDVSPSETLRFHTLSGPLSARRTESWIELDFPAGPASPAPAPPGLLEALGVEATYVGRTKFDYLVQIASPQVLRTMQPDMARLACIPGTRGVIVTSVSDLTSFEFLSRFFAPAYGIPEDPVTGSAHCSLAPYWGEKLGRTAMIGYQASRRGGEVRVTVVGERVRLGGRAVTILRGTLEG